MTFTQPDIEMQRRPDGTVLLASRRAAAAWEESVPAVLRARAAEHPDRPLAAQRDGNDRWMQLSYGEARSKADALAQAFLDLGLGPDRPVLILSGNSVEHLLVTLAGYTAGVPVAPISVAYSLMSSDHARIKAIAELVEPGLVFADDAAAFGAALDSVGTQALVARGERTGALRLEDLCATVPCVALEDAFASVGADTTAKLLFTSGSTAVPKGVINTHRMLCANQAMLRQIWPFLQTEPPILVDWLPWSHTFGANHNLNLALFNGGTIHIDDGKPAPPLFHRTLAALREIAPTLYFNVPAGFALLAPALERDDELARHFFSRLRFMFYAGAALPEALAVRLRELAARVADHEVPLTSSWGTTETAPAATSAHFNGAAMGCIGVPIPGVSVKLAPEGERLEIRVAGPNVTPGYYRATELTAAAFDEEGFYRSGDAGKLVDEDDPNQGVLFDGRVAENFKLMTGTWVTTGTLRLALLSAARVLSDAVICGHDREFVAALAWVNQAEARKLLSSEDDVALDDRRLREHLGGALAALNQGAGSAARVERLILLAEPPSLDAGEITDKGYINQRACLERRGGSVEELFAAEPGEEVIAPSSVVGGTATAH
ncbi:MAG: feruloyl-CoA synthase [Solirubrobacteraceae bacterium]